MKTVPVLPMVLKCRRQCVGFSSAVEAHTNPAANRGPEAFRMKRAEWTHFEELMISCRPVVQHDEAEDVLFRFGYGHALAVRDRLADEVAHFELVVHFPSGPEGDGKCY